MARSAVDLGIEAGPGVRPRPQNPEHWTFGDAQLQHRCVVERAPLVPRVSKSSHRQRLQRGAPRLGVPGDERELRGRELDGHDGGTKPPPSYSHPDEQDDQNDRSKGGRPHRN